MKVLIPGIFVVLLLIWIPQPALAHSGCCSAHGGVSGCGCADGTPLSATCLPYYPECSGAAATGSTPTDMFTPVPVQEPTGTATPLPPTTGPLVSPSPVARPTIPEPHPIHSTRRMRHTRETAISSKPSSFLSSFLSFFSGIFGGRGAHPANTPLASASQSGTATSHTQCTATHINAEDPQAYLPDPHCTPGSINPSVTQTTIFATICKSGYTKTIRPRASYTDALKRKQIQAYGYTDTNLSDYEEDHFISLELGGNPTDPHNLWPEPKGSPNEKDLVENYLHEQVCSGALSLAQAQQKISTDWYSVYAQIR